jgi:hypothetical protein
MRKRPLAFLEKRTKTGAISVQKGQVSAQALTAAAETL